MSQNASDIRAKLEQLATDMELLRRMVHGTDTETVPLGTPPVPTSSLRKMAKDIDARESRAALVVVNAGLQRLELQGAQQVAAATSQAQASAQSAGRASAHASAAQADAARACFCADAAREAYEDTYTLSGQYEHQWHNTREEVTTLRLYHALTLASLTLAAIKAGRTRLFEIMHSLRIQPHMVSMDDCINRINKAKRGILYG